MSCHHSHVLTVPQTSFCASGATSTSAVESHDHCHQSQLLQRRRRLPQLQLRHSVSSQQLSPPSLPSRHHRQQKQQELHLKIQQQLEQQRQQQIQQWQQTQLWQQGQKCALQQHHHDASISAVNDNGTFNNVHHRHVSVGSLTPSQSQAAIEAKTPVVQHEFDYITMQMQQNDNTQYSSQFSQNYQLQHENTYKLFDGDANVKLFSQDATVKEPDLITPTASFSYFNNIVKEQPTTLLSGLSLDFLTDFEQFSLDRQIDFLKTSESRIDDEVQTFSYFTVQPNTNLVYPTIFCSTNIDSFVNPLEAAPDICKEARPGSAYYKITISTSSGAVLNGDKDNVDKSSNMTSLCGLNKLQVLSEIQNLELITSPKFNDFPQHLKEYLLSERMILADVRSIIDNQPSEELQSCNENNMQRKSTEEVPSPESKTYANILQSVPQYDLNSSSKSDEHCCNSKLLPAAKRSNRRSKYTNSYHNVNNLKNGIKKLNHNEFSNSVAALEKRKRTKIPYKFRKPSQTNNKNSKIYNDSWRVEVFNGKKIN